MTIDLAHIDVVSLWKHHDHFVINHQVERQVVAACFGPDCEILDHPEGFFPQYDYKLLLFGETFAIEQKITQRMRTKTHPHVLIETAYADGTLSGLSLTQSDFYLILCPQWEGRSVIKARLFSTKMLRQQVICETTVGYQASPSGPGSRGFYLNIYEAPHIWIGDFDINIDETWDLTSLCRTNRWIENQIKQWVRNKYVSTS